MCEADEFSDFRWRTHEREVFRELNKNPFIAYPIKQTVNTMAHKASLLLQAALGCVDMSDVPEPVRRQITMDTGLLFERMHRLVRAVIECKASDLDGVTCRVALDLARSMGARAWEGKSMQLTQVPQLGPVFMRKFVSSGITTIHDLVKAGASNIERILSRNPPFGKKMTDELAHFPRLTLEARIATDSPRTFDQDRQPVVRIDAILGFSNASGKPKWRGKIPSVTFMAETTEGVLAHWWRGSMKKFKEEDGHKISLQFEVDLRSFFETIICHFACEEIVGTVVTRTLEHGLPASAFISKKESTSQLSRTSDGFAASLMDDEIGDDDLLEITKEGRDQGEACFVTSGDSGVDSQWPTADPDRKSHVDDRVPKKQYDFASAQEGEKENIPWQPIQLPNGKFKCNHQCADAGLKNGNGKACAHRCCREGLDAPRKPKAKGLKRKTGMEEIVVADPASKLTPKSTNKRAKPTVSQSRTASRNLPREPLTSATTNRQAYPPMNLDDFDLDGDGLFDLTQVGGTHVDDLKNSNFSANRVRRPTSKEGSHDDETDLLEDLFGDSFQDILVSPLGSRVTTGDNDRSVGKRTNPLHAKFPNTQSNNIDNFSGDSVFDGVVVDECDGRQRPSHNSMVGGMGVARERRGNSHDVSLHRNRGIESSWEGPFSETGPTIARDLDHLLAQSPEDVSRSNVVCHSPSHSGMASRVKQAGIASPAIIPLQKGPDAEAEAKEYEDETYIFSEDYVLPPPRDSFGEDSVILSQVSNAGQLPHNAEARTVHKSAEADGGTSKNSDTSMKLQQGQDWEGFEPGFTDEFRDLVEFI